MLYEQLGKPYVLGGSGPDVFDCSGLVYYCLKRIGINIGRLNAQGYSDYDGWTKIDNISDMRRGDLIFYWNDSHSRVSHVGVYLGNNKYIHASSSHGEIEIADFGSWSISHFKHARRIFD